MTPPPQKSLNDFFMEKYSQPMPKAEDLPVIKKTDGTKPEPKLSREEKREQKKFVDTMMYGLSAPIVFGSKQWASSYPDKQIEFARMMRLAKAGECMDQEMCTLTDIVAFFYPLSMDAPLRHEYYKMYIYAYKHGLPTEWKLLIESDPDIERDSELYDNEHEELRILRRKIFNRQMNLVKSRG